MCFCDAKKRACNFGIKSLHINQGSQMPGFNLPYFKEHPVLFEKNFPLKV
jgi:hypothetical protein